MGFYDFLLFSFVWGLIIHGYFGVTMKPLGFLEVISIYFFRLKRIRYEREKDVISYYKLLLLLPALHGVGCLQMQWQFLLIEIKIRLRVVNF